jgi:hypothetical protein
MAADLATPDDDGPDGVADAAPAPRPTALQLITAASLLPPGRVPVDEQPLRELGNRSLVPPRSSRAPWQGRVAAMLDHDNNLLLTPDQRRQATAWVLSPGVNWLSEAPRLRAEVDASLEWVRGTELGASDSRLDAGTVSAQLLAQPGSTTSVRYDGLALHAHDTQGNLALPPANASDGSAATAAMRRPTELWRQSLLIGQRLDERTSVDLQAGAARAWSANAGFVTTQLRDLGLGAQWRLSPRHTWSVALRRQDARFDGGLSTWRDSASLQWRGLWSATGQGEVALGPSWGGGATRAWQGRAGLRGSWAHGTWEAAAERAVVAPEGQGRLYLQRSLRIGAAWRAAPGLLLDASLQAADYDPRASSADAPSATPLGGGNGVRVWRPRLSASWALGGGSWGVLRYQRLQDLARDSGVQRQGDRLLLAWLHQI